ncbi:hypothetical protein JZ751_021635 [Albula glossodonta]|uniref:Uncharacterized protein n=1 Tax=Albula glossodonta TaxID=121402 RepID=A0A8T2NKJ5_9TELE|nr:hypothetical protein JZ751_021635 [Albula glossodonta]
MRRPKTGRMVLATCIGSFLILVFYFHSNLKPVLPHWTRLDWKKSGHWRSREWMRGGREGVDGERERKKERGREGE